MPRDSWVRHTRQIQFRSTLSPGTRLGAYEILEQLGAGGMGEVYRARDTRLGREVAIKTVSLHDRHSQAEALTRVEQEARSTSALNHPNIVNALQSLHFAGAAAALRERLGTPLTAAEQHKLDEVLEFAREPSAMPQV